MEREELMKRISIDPTVCFGKPRVRGRRIWVSLVLDLLASGMKTEEVMREYDLAEEDVLACIAYGAEMSRERTTTSPGLMILPEGTLVATTGISAMSLMRPVTVTFSGEGPFPTDSVAVVKPRKSSREENFACMARASAGSTLGIFDTRTSYISMDPVSFHGLFRWISPMKTLLRSSADTSTVLGTACTLADPEKTNAPR